MENKTKDDTVSLQVVNYKVNVIDENVKSINVKFDDFREKYFATINSMNSLRNDVNVANQTQIEMKQEFRKFETTVNGKLDTYDTRIESLESFEKIVKYTGKLVKWLLGFVGFQNIVIVLYVVVKFVTQGSL